MKTRILKVDKITNNNTETFYYPQYKWLFWWRNFSKMSWWSNSGNTHQDYISVCYKHKKDAIRFIDNKTWECVLKYRNRFKIYRQEFESDYIYYYPGIMVGTYSKHTVTCDSLEEMKRIIDIWYPVKKIKCNVVL